MNARYYIPSIGKFASADTLVPDPTNPQSYNRYSYTLNNPLKYTDPTGHISCEELGTEECDKDGNYIDSPPLPISRYYYVNGFYFDEAHIGGGRALTMKIIQNVTEAIQREGGTFDLERSFRGLLTFEMSFTILPNTELENVLGISLGVFMLFETGWEIWQSNIGLDELTGSSFAIEDLPSDYTGFFLAANPKYNLSMALSSLGQVEAISSSPPHESTLMSLFSGNEGSKNFEFAPKKLINGIWVNVPWPPALQMTPIYDNWYLNSWNQCWGTTCN